MSECLFRWLQSSLNHSLLCPFAFSPIQAVDAWNSFALLLVTQYLHAVPHLALPELPRVRCPRLLHLATTSVEHYLGVHEQADMASLPDERVCMRYCRDSVEVRGGEYAARLRPDAFHEPQDSERWQNPNAPAPLPINGRRDLNCSQRGFDPSRGLVGHFAP